MKTIHFLSGLPRSGSTLLAAILNQNSKLHVSPTSPLLELLTQTESTVKKLQRNYTFDSLPIPRALAEALYANTEANIVFDKHRGWPQNIPAIKKTLCVNPKLICMYRPVSEIITSYITFHGLNADASMYIWDEYVKPTYESLKYGLDNYREHIHLISYDQLVDNTKETISHLYDFLDLKHYDHSYFDLEYSEENDLKWSALDLHLVRPEILKISKNPTEILGTTMVSYFDQYNFAI